MTTIDSVDQHVAASNAQFHIDRREPLPRFMAQWLVQVSKFARDPSSVYQPKDRWKGVKPSEGITRDLPLPKPKGPLAGMTPREAGRALMLFARELRDGMDSVFDAHDRTLHHASDARYTQADMLHALSRLGAVCGANAAEIQAVLDEAVDRRLPTNVHVALVPHEEATS